MKPCDCKSMTDVIDMLDEGGIGYNNWSISVVPMAVEINTINVRIRIPQTTFKAFAEWYLADQTKEG